MTSSQMRWVGAAALALTLPAGWAMFRVWTRPERPQTLTEFHGVRLGMSAHDVREAFDRALSVDMSDELALVWTRDEGQTFHDPALGDVQNARFEFHLGLLVAIRATGQTGRRDHHELTLSHAALRRVADDTQGRATLTLIARDCPTHAEEVRRLTAN